eukprot:NODE_324_length_10963_cov_0.175350.p2 type:complete len:535 gc:universal NODE_324_length_10963_cov_0.175350:7003-5399(-)
MMKRIFIYSDNGTSPASVKNTIKWIKKHTLLDVSPIMHNEFHLLSICELLVIPGGRDKPYCELVNSKSDLLLNYMYNGGKYLGICAGAYFASSFVEFQLDTPYQVIGKRPLSLFNGTAMGTIYPNFQYQSESGAHVVPISGDFKTLCYYNGGPMFIAHDNLHSPIMRYDLNNEMAILKVNVGKGTAVLSGVHLEYDEHEDKKLNQKLLSTQRSRNKLSAYILNDIFNLPVKEKVDMEAINNFKSGGYLNQAVYSFKKVNLPNLTLSASKSFELKNARYDFTDVVLDDFDFLYAPVIHSTQSYLLSSNLHKNTVFMASHQTEGYGRSKNEWISLIGCLQASLYTSLSMESSKLPVIQLLVADAICRAIHSCNPIFKERIKIKWPNDIIDIHSKCKLGGILVNSEFQCNSFNEVQNRVKLIVGFGINVFNKQPVGCLNDIAPIESVQLLKHIANNIFSILQQHSTNLQTFDHDLKKDYITNWAHSNQVVDYHNEKMTIFDVNSNGNLLAKSKEDVYEISSDGNKFDFWNNMILRKI